MTRNRWSWTSLLIPLVWCALSPSPGTAQVNENLTSVRNPKKMDCAMCHSLHGGTAATLLKLAKNELCQSCHDPSTGTDPLAPKVLTHLNTSTNSLYAHKEECLDCHNPHYSLVNRRGRLGKLPQDPPTENVCQDGNPNNNIICRNFRLLANLRDEINGAGNLYMLSSIIRVLNDDGCRRNCPVPILTQSNLGTFSMDKATNQNQTDEGWETNTATANNAWLQANFGAVGTQKEVLEVRLYSQLANHLGVYDVQYSDDGTNWSVAAANFAPTAQGVNRVRWAQGTFGAHQYWRILLKNTPGPTNPIRWISEVSFHAPSDCTDTGGTTVFDTDSTSPTFNFYLGCRRTIVAGRELPITVSGIDYNDWTSPTAPYQGICNTCHTRTEHHRNNDLATTTDFYHTSPDHTHNASRRCADCHDHAGKGFSKGQ